MTVPIDFTLCERLPGRAYNGANGKKIAIRYDGDVWMLKFPPSAAEKPTALSYTNSCLSEHLATPENSFGYKISLTGIILVVAMIMVAKSIFEGTYRKKLDMYLQQLAEATDTEVKGAISKEINSLKTKQDIYERLVLLLPFVIILLLTTIAIKWLKDLQSSVGLVTACIAGGSVFNIIKRPIKERVRLQKITEKAKR